MKHVLLAAALSVLPVAAHAQTADDLIRQLGGMKAGGPTRGIHAMTPAPTASAQLEAPPVRSRISTVATRVPVKAPAVAEAQGQANLTVQFENGSAKLTPAAIRTLDTLGQALVSPGLAADKFRIVGHTDSVGNPDGNQVLSQRRAEAVVAYLGERFRIDPARLAPVGMGQSEPLVPTAVGVPAPQNRRVQVINLGA